MKNNFALNCIRSIKILMSPVEVRKSPSFINIRVKGIEIPPNSISIHRQQLNSQFFLSFSVNSQGAIRHWPRRYSTQHSLRYHHLISKQCLQDLNAPERFGMRRRMVECVHGSTQFVTSCNQYDFRNLPEKKLLQRFYRLEKL